MPPAASLIPLLLVCLTLAFASPALAAPPEEQPPPSGNGTQIQLYVENDVLAGTDRYYTNGLKIGVGQQLQALARLLEPASNRILGWLTDAGPNSEAGLFIGQNLYTPRNIRKAEAQPSDRPWAAWL